MFEPALMGLWSDYDAQSGHKLRYDQRSLRRVLGAARGADIVEVSWFNHLLVPFMWLLRRGRATAEPGMSVPAAPVNLAFLSWLRAEYWADGRLGALRTRLPGASLFFAVRRSPAS